jgi:hypothetical protein
LNVGKWIGIGLLSAVASLPVLLIASGLLVPDSLPSAGTAFGSYILIVMAFMGIFGLIYRTMQNGTARHSTE